MEKIFCQDLAFAYQHVAFIQSVAKDIYECFINRKPYTISDPLLLRISEAVKVISSTTVGPLLNNPHAQLYLQIWKVVTDTPRDPRLMLGAAFKKSITMESMMRTMSTNSSKSIVLNRGHINLDLVYRRLFFWDDKLLLISPLQMGYYLYLVRYAIDKLHGASKLESMNHFFQFVNLLEGGNKKKIYSKLFKCEAAQKMYQLLPQLPMVIIDIIVSYGCATDAQVIQRLLTRPEFVSV